MRKLISLSVVICLLAFVITAGGCGKPSGRNCLGFYVSDYEIIEENDSHGGFHGDGTYTLKLDCSKNREKAKNALKGWNELPLSENVSLLMYGGTKDGREYGYNLADLGNFPEIESGYYKFYDEQSSNHSDDSELFDRYSFNVKVGIYDIETDILYYVEFDT